MKPISAKIDELSNIDKQNSLVIDVTYCCNSSCSYCQWGDTTKFPVEINYEELLIPKSILSILNVERVVLSGGEPLLHKRLTDIIDYYNKQDMDSIVLLTNGIDLDKSELQNLANHGLTGVTFSIDSLEYEVSKKTRSVSEDVFRKIINNLLTAMKFKESHNIELGINCVVSSSNLQSKHLLPLVHFCNKNNIDWLKFQPIFDDGYLSINAPQLKLKSKHSKTILKIGKQIIQSSKILTNNYEFWKSLSDILEGKKLLGKSCGLGTRQSILIRGDLKFCYWLDDPIYTRNLSELSEDNVQIIRKRFYEAREKCKTGMYCFCLQSLSHKWEISK